MHNRQGHPFFDVVKFPWNRPEAIDLHIKVSQSIYHPTEIRKIYEESKPSAGNLPDLNLQQPPSHIWQDALENLTVHGALPNFLSRLELRFPNSEPMKATIRAVREAQPIGISEEKDIPEVDATGPDITTGKLLFTGHEILGRFFTMNPAKLAGMLFLLSTLCLVMPSVFLQIHFIKCNNGNHGFLHPANWNWGILYALVIPLLFAMAVWASHRMREGVFILHRRLKIIKAREQTSTADYLQALSDRLAQSAKKLLVFTTVLVIVAMIVDTWDLWIGFYRNQFPKSVKPDWDTAFTGFSAAWYVDPKVAMVNCPGFNPPPPSWWSNLVFDIVAYSFQAAAIFLGFFWVAKFWLFLRALSDLLRESGSNYCLVLLENDPTRRLGLRPMGKMFNWFLVITVLLQVYVFVHRIQVIDKWRLDEVGAYSYVSEVGHKFFTSAWLQSRFYGFDGLRDPGVWIALILITFPIIAVCYFPLYTLRRYIGRCKDAAYEAYITKHEQAKDAGDEDKAREYQKKMTELKGANVWPNGDNTAKRFLAAMTILGIASWLPPLLPIMLSAWILLEVSLTFLSRVTGLSHSDT